MVCLELSLATLGPDPVLYQLFAMQNRKLFPTRKRKHPEIGQAPTSQARPRDADHLRPSNLAARTYFRPEKKKHPEMGQAPTSQARPRDRPPTALKPGSEDSQLSGSHAVQVWWRTVSREAKTCGSGEVLCAKNIYFVVTFLGDYEAIRRPRSKETGRGAVAMTRLSHGEHPQCTHCRLQAPSSLAQTAKNKEKHAHRQRLLPACCA